MTQIKDALPVSGVRPKQSPEVCPERSPEERNICKQLGKVRRYLAKSTDANIKSLWESRITVYEKQLAKAEARARFIR